MQFTDEQQRFIDEHYQLLPVDADGAPIHIGDEVDSNLCEDGVVVGLQYFRVPNDGLRLGVAVKPHGWDTPTWHDPEEYRRHHAPTVEDVLQKLLEQAVGYSDAHTTVALNAIAECAAKLRLAGEDA